MLYSIIAHFMPPYSTYSSDFLDFHALSLLNRNVSKKRLLGLSVFGSAAAAMLKTNQRHCSRSHLVDKLRTVRGKWSPIPSCLSRQYSDDVSVHTQQFTIKEHVCMKDESLLLVTAR